ncbi:MAG: hypothetical protein U0164_12815 [Gemmatimonadaceae bacterium]
MAKGRTVEFEGDVGTSGVINQDLPQPGQYIGRRIIQIADISTKYWLAEASSLGTPWSEALGLTRAESGMWEIAKPEKLTSTWFARRRKIPRSSSVRTMQLAEAQINQSAREAMLQQGSLASWVRSRGRGTTAAKVYDYDSSTGNTTPNTSSGTPDKPDNPKGGNGGTVDDETNDFHESIGELLDGVIQVPAPTWGGATSSTPIDVEEPPVPALFLVQVIGISAFLGEYGLGKTVKTFTLLPGETTTISTRTWRATEESVALASSIIDSYTESAADRFAETVMTETTDTATQEKTENWHAEAEVKGSFGFGSASVSGGGGGEYSSSTEEFAKSVDEAVSEHSAESSAQRENTVTSNSERSESTEDEEVIERTITNINVGRVLNFTFRELNQVYLTRTHLKEVRIAFSNGNSGSWREEPVSNMRKLVAEVIDPQYVDSVCQDLLRTIAVAFDKDGLPVPVLDQVVLSNCGRTATVTDATPGKQCQYTAPTEDGTLYYRFKRGPLGQPTDDPYRVDGVLLKERSVIMSTDSVVVESLLGVNSSLDAYSTALQNEAIREKKLANDREQLAHAIVTAKDAEAAAVYAQVYAPGADEVVTP